MTNKIDDKIVSTLKDVIDIMRTEADADAYPYSVYELDVEDNWTKTGVTKISGSMVIYVYATDYSTVAKKVSKIKDSIGLDMQSAEYRTKLRRENVSCESNIWVGYLEYYVAQYDVPYVPPVEESNNNN